MKILHLLRQLNKKIKKDHALAQQLWATGNHDARVFATMIADPEQADDALLEAWVNDLGNYVIAIGSRGAELSQKAWDTPRSHSGLKYK